MLLGEFSRISTRSQRSQLFWCLYSWSLEDGKCHHFKLNHSESPTVARITQILNCISVIWSCRCKCDRALSGSVTLSAFLKVTSVHWECLIGPCDRDAKCSAAGAGRVHSVRNQRSLRNKSRWKTPNIPRHRVQIHYWPTVWLHLCTF